MIDFKITHNGRLVGNGRCSTVPRTGDLFKLNGVLFMISKVIWENDPFDNSLTATIQLVTYS